MWMMFSPETRDDLNRSTAGAIALGQNECVLCHGDDLIRVPYTVEQWDLGIYQGLQEVNWLAFEGYGSRLINKTVAI